MVARLEGFEAQGIKCLEIWVLNLPARQIGASRLVVGYVSVIEALNRGFSPFLTLQVSTKIILWLGVSLQHEKLCERVAVSGKN